MSLGQTLRRILLTVCAAQSVKMRNGDRLPRFWVVEPDDMRVTWTRMRPPSIVTVLAMDKVHGMAEHRKASVYEGRQTEFRPYGPDICGEFTPHGRAEEGVVKGKRGTDIFKQVRALPVFEVTIPIGHPGSAIYLRTQNFLKAPDVGVFGQDVVTDRGVKVPGPAIQLEKLQRSRPSSLSPVHISSCMSAIGR